MTDSTYDLYDKVCKLVGKYEMTDDITNIFKKLMIQHKLRYEFNTLYTELLHYYQIVKSTGNRPSPKMMKCKRICEELIKKYDILNSSYLRIIRLQH